MTSRNQHRIWGSRAQANPDQTPNSHAVSCEGSTGDGRGGTL